MIAAREAAIGGSSGDTSPASRATRLVFFKPFSVYRGALSSWRSAQRSCPGGACCRFEDACRGRRRIRPHVGKEERRPEIARRLPLACPEPSKRGQRVGWSGSRRRERRQFKRHGTAPVARRARIDLRRTSYPRRLQQDPRAERVTKRGLAHHCTTLHPPAAVVAPPPVVSAPAWTDKSRVGDLVDKGGGGSRSGRQGF